MPTPEKCDHPSWPHLWDEVPSELNVFGDHVGCTHGDEIPESLNLMNDWVSIWHFGSVIEDWKPMWANHLINLPVDSLCTEKWNQKTSFKEAFQQRHCFLWAKEPGKKTIIKGYMIDIPQGNQLGVGEAKEEARKIPTLMFNECYDSLPMCTSEHTHRHTPHMHNFP